MIVSGCLEALVSVAFYLEVRVSYDNTIQVLCIYDGSRNQKVRKLDLKQHHIMLKEEESPVH